MDFIQEAIDGLYIAAKNKGLSMKDACEGAGVHPTTPSRWRAGQSPRMFEFETLRRFIESHDNTKEVISMAKKAVKKPAKAMKVVKQVKKKK